MYLNLLYRALKLDVNTRRVQAFAKRLLQTAAMSDPPLAIGILCLVRELEATFPNIRAMINQAEEDDEEEKYVDVRSDDGEDGSLGPVSPDLERFRYDGRKRDPIYSNADRSCLWELVSQEIRRDLLTVGPKRTIRPHFPFSHQCIYDIVLKLMKCFTT